MIPQETVQQVLQAADVVDVIGDFVSLKKRGANMIACCPFHNEKTPSFYVSPSKQIYKCFGCGKGGDTLRFIMDLEGLSYPDAIKWLAKKYGIEIIEKEFTDAELVAQNERESLYIVHEYARDFFYKQLNESEEGQSIGLSYFKERGFSKQIIEQFELGYAPDSYDALTQAALKSGYTLQTLEKAGLTIIREGKSPIDRFRGRVVFPIHNVAGKPVAFGARVLKVDPKSPKYLNSPETEIYHKSNLVYGIFQAKVAMRRDDVCYLVEGYTDVTSLHQAGVDNVVASSGTSLTKEQIQLIRRFSSNITILYDGDAAGIRASLRGTSLILEEGMNVRVVLFPDGEDPDSYVRKVGSEDFQKYIQDNQQDFIRFKTEISLKDVGEDPIKKAGLITELVETITLIPDPIKRAVFYQETAHLLQIDEQILLNEGNKILRKKVADRNRSVGNQVSQPDFASQKVADLLIETEKSNITLKAPIQLQEEIFIRDLVIYGNEVLEKDPETGTEISLASYILDEITGINFETPILGTIMGICREMFTENQQIDTRKLISHENQEIQQLVVNWLSPRYELSEKWVQYEIFVPKYVDRLDELAYRNILRIKKEKFESEMRMLYEELGHIEGEDEQDQLLERMSKLKKIIMKLADELGSVI